MLERIKNNSFLKQLLKDPNEKIDQLYIFNYNIINKTKIKFYCYKILNIIEIDTIYIVKLKYNIKKFSLISSLITFNSYHIKKQIKNKIYLNIKNIKFKNIIQHPINIKYKIIHIIKRNIYIIYIKSIITNCIFGLISKTLYNDIIELNINTLKFLTIKKSYNYQIYKGLKYIPHYFLN